MLHSIDSLDKRKQTYKGLLHLLSQESQIQIQVKAWAYHQREELLQISASEWQIWQEKSPLCLEKCLHQTKSIL